MLLFYFVQIIALGWAEYAHRLFDYQPWVKTGASVLSWGLCAGGRRAHHLS